MVIELNKDYLLFDGECILCYYDLHGDESFPTYEILEDYPEIKKKLIEDGYDNFD